MTCTLHVAWDDRLAGYDFGPAHPMAPVRLKLTMELDPASPCPLTDAALGPNDVNALSTRMAKGQKHVSRGPPAGR
jgi:hypothetical protein